MIGLLVSWKAGGTIARYLDDLSRDENEGLWAEEALRRAKEMESGEVREYFLRTCFATCALAIDDSADLVTFTRRGGAKRRNRLLFLEDD